MEDEYIAYLAASARDQLKTDVKNSSVSCEATAVDPARKKPECRKVSGEPIYSALTKGAEEHARACLVSKFVPSAQQQKRAK